MVREVSDGPVDHKQELQAWGSFGKASDRGDTQDVENGKQEAKRSCQEAADTPAIFLALAHYPKVARVSAIFSEEPLGKSTYGPLGYRRMDLSRFYVTS
jgi:hypothetical protein